MIIGIHGFKQSGKDTLADLLVEEFGFEKIAFADRLKNALNTIFNVPKEDLWGSDDDKKKLTSVKWNSLVGLSREDRFDEEYLNIRELMQIFATEICRSYIPGIWYEFLKIKQGENIVISDVRFENEAIFLRSKNAHLIKVKRNDVYSSEHLSEKGIDDDLMDKVFLNNGSLEEFLVNSKKELADWIESIGK